MDVRFVIVAPATKRQSIPVRLPILAGRSEEAKFRIQQDSVSRRHCEFFLKDDAVFVRDMGSTNGTLLDDELIPASVPTRVKPGSIVRIGSVAFRVDYTSPAAGKTAAADDAPPPTRVEDTVPMDDADPSEPVIGPATEEQPAPAEQDVPALEPAAAEEPAESEPSAQPEPADGTQKPAATGKGFGFLAADEEPDKPDDEELGNFFKSLK
jgi:predicted component of type VI protein secretion system